VQVRPNVHVTDDDRRKGTIPDLACGCSFDASVDVTDVPKTVDHNTTFRKSPKQHDAPAQVHWSPTTISTNCCFATTIGGYAVLLLNPLFVHGYWRNKGRVPDAWTSFLLRAGGIRAVIAVDFAFEPSSPPPSQKEVRMIDRFTGSDGPRRVRQAVYEQQCIAHNDTVTDAIMGVHQLVFFKAGEQIIVQGAHDNDIYFILAGTASIQVNGREMAIRGAGLHVGEMALIQPASKRSATVIAIEPVVAAKISEPDFATVAEKHPYLWRRLAMELAERLRERSKHVRAPNPRPVLFIGSSVEGLQVAKEIQSGLAHLNSVVHIWTNNVFVPGHYTIEDLERQIGHSDFGIIACTQDDKIVNEDRGINTYAPRDNCILELGMCIGQLGRERTVLVRPRTKDIKIPTDLLGVTPAEYCADDPANLSAHIGPVCTAIEKLVKSNTPR
jgi:predicted nucleotide-binding protein